MSRQSKSTDTSMLRALRRAQRTQLWVSALEDRITPANFQVTTLAADNSAGSLRAAIESANASPGADTITFGALFNTAQTIPLGGNELLISDDLTLTGPGAAGTAPTLTLDGGGTSRVFNITSAITTTPITVALSGLIVTGGATAAGVLPTPDGAGIFVDDESVTLDRVAVRNNTITGGAGDSGGGISIFTGGSLVIRNSTVSANSTTGNGGGIYFFNGGSLLVENCTITGNTATSTSNLQGPGIYFAGIVGAGGLTVRNTTIQGNSAPTGSGGGILLNAFTGELRVLNSTITGNSALINNANPGRGGGGIALRTVNGSGNVTIQSSVVSGNMGNAAQGRHDISIGTGGGINIDHSAIGVTTGFTYADPTGTNLAVGATLDLGALQDNGGPTFTMVPAAGSPLINAGSNPAPAVQFDQRGHARNQGGAVDIGAVEVDAAAVPTATGNFTNVTTPGVTSYSFQVTYSDTSSPINTATLDNNDVRVTGPNGFDVLATRGTFDAANPNAVVVNYSVAAPSGTFTAAANGTYTITVQANQVATMGGTFVPMTNVGNFQVILATTFHVTSAADNGPGTLREAITLANGNLAGTDDIIVFDGPTFGTTPATITLDTALPIITQSLTINGPGPAANLLTITRDAAAATQFGILNATGAGVLNVFLSNLVITGGSTTGGGGGGTVGDGAGIFASNENLTLDNVVVTGNTSSSEGGGIAFGTNAGLLTVRNSTISGNTSNGVPAGPTFAGAGGGIYFAANGSILIENSTISGNTSTASDGGGVYFYGVIGAGGFTVRNSTIAGNTAGLAGGGIGFRNLTGTLNVEHSTITGNTANGGVGGGGIAQSVGTAGIVTILSSIVSGNTNAAAPDVSSPGTVNVNFSAIGSITGFTPTGANNLPEGAVLNLGTLGNNGGPTQTIALGAGSPAINAGPATTPGISFDQRGAPNQRVSGSAADIGAFEVQTAGPAPTVTSTVVNGSTSSQRSRVTSVNVTFSAAVTFASTPAAAFTLTRVNGGAVNFTATANTVGGVTVVTLGNFTGTETDSGSLRDGNYTLTTLANQVSVGGTQMAANHTFGGATLTDNFYRFYGDVAGVDRRVDISDFGFFSLAYLTPANYNVALDFNNDGRIDIADFGQFSVRYFTTLP